MTVIITHVARRFSDLDPLGHVNNTMFLDYLQEARIRAMHEIGYLEGVNFSQVMAHQSIDFRKPIHYSLEPLTIEVWISAIGRTSYHLNYRIINEHGILNAEAESVMVCFDNDKAVPIPPKMREALLAVAELE